MDHKESSLYDTEEARRIVEETIANDEADLNSLCTRAVSGPSRS